MSDPNYIDPVTGAPTPYQPGYPAAGGHQQPVYPVQQPGYGPPQQAGYGPPTGGGPAMLTIGDIAVTQTEVIVPHGRYPLRGTTWTVQDNSHTTENIPVYAIVLAIVFFLFCLLGLLFLLIKERKTVGFITVNVMGDGLFHATQIPANPAAMAMVNQQVNMARSMAAAAG